MSNVLKYSVQNIGSREIRVRVLVSDLVGAIKFLNPRLSGLYFFTFGEYWLHVEGYERSQYDTDDDEEECWDTVASVNGEMLFKIIAITESSTDKDDKVLFVLRDDVLKFRLEKVGDEE